MASGEALGFWKGWGLSVGAMIGSGIFMMPTLLAPYGWLGMGGWLITGGGALLLALVYARLARNIPGSGGPFHYARAGFGNFTGFLVGWGYWISLCVAIPAIAVAAVGYLAFLMPETLASSSSQMVAGLAIIWSLVALNIRSVSGSGGFMLVTTILKILPLLLIAILGFMTPTDALAPAFNPASEAPLAVLSATAMLTMWAFIGVESATVPAGEIENPRHNVPKILIAGVITVLAVYLLSSLAVFLTVPAEKLATSTAPFSDAAAILMGPGAAILITLGALISTVGATNAHILLAGQVPLAGGRVGLFPKPLAHCTKSGTPVTALIVSAMTGSIILTLNYSGGLVAAFEFLMLLSTFTALVPMAVSALVDLRFLTRTERARGWVRAIILNLLAFIYTIFVIIGAGIETIGWGMLLLGLCAPIYLLLRKDIQDHEPVSSYEL